jgi:hypothetical protein
MKPLRKDDLLPYEEYERVRESFRKEIIALKSRRRISIGDKITLIFENRETVRFQVQEMIRVERIFDPAKIQDELDVYNAQLPQEGELSATLFIEITDSAHIQRDLDALQGIDGDKTVAIRAGSDVVYAAFEQGRSKEDKISAVHFLKFRPTKGVLGALRQSEPVSLAINHPAYKAQVAVPEALRQEWLADLSVSHRPGEVG